MDGLGDLAKDLHDKADDLAEQHGDKIDQGIGKASDLAQSKVGDDKDDDVRKAEAKARDVLDDLRKPD